MANALYDLGRQGFLDGTIDWDTAYIHAALVRGYTPNLATDQFLSTITTANIVGVPITLASKTATGGVADAADITFPAVPAGAAIPYIAIYQSSATTPALQATLGAGTIGSVSAANAWGTYYTCAITGLTSTATVTVGANITSTGTVLPANSFVKSVDSGTALTVASPTLPTGGAATAVQIYDLAATAQRLIALLDTTTGVTLPVTPNGGDIIVAWDNGANKIFKL